MSEEERIKTLINNIKLNINEQNVYEFGLCVEQWKQILDYIEQLQQENKELQERIDKAIEELKKGLHELDTRRREEVYVEEYIEESIDILEEVNK